MSGDKIRQLEAWVESRPPGVATQKDDGPFFSILVRTMGDRNDLLYEALISIAAQTFESYEVLVLAHRCPDLGPLRALVAGLPAFFGEKVRLIPIEEGTRCRPLNVGLDEARGRFIGFLDDDDLMLANHLETVRSGVEGAEALHTFGAVRSIETEGGRTFPYTTSKISIDFTMPFSAFRQMSRNWVHLSTFFVARGVVERYGIRFDETIDLLEDNRFVMDANAFVEVRCLPVVTTAVNIRSNATNTVKNPEYRERWDRAWEELREHVASSPRVFSPAEMRELMPSVAQLEEALVFWRGNRHLPKMVAPMLKVAKAVLPLVPRRVKAAVRRRMGF